MTQQQRGQQSPKGAKKPPMVAAAPPTPPPPAGIPAPAAPRLPLSIREGSIWCWEPLNPRARAECTVTATRWNGEEWWIELETGRDKTRHWNDLDRFIEAAVLVRPGPQDVTP
jgi:hypothetical protein